MVQLSRPAGPPRYLNGWKAIAAYLGRDQSTVRRWAAGDTGFPVHRPQTGAARRGAVVYALAHELDDWVTRYSRDAAVPAPETDLVPKAAQDLYLEGVYLWQKRTIPALQAAEARMREALEIAPQYISAQAELAVIYDMMVDYGALPQDEGYARAGRAAERALMLDPDSARARSVLADIAFYGHRDFATGLKLHQHAAERAPEDPLCHHWSAAALSLGGNPDRARAAVQKAKALYPSSRQVIYTEAVINLGIGDYLAARRLLADLVEHEIGFANPFRLLAFAELGRGDLAAYLDAWQKHLSLKGEVATRRVLAASNWQAETVEEAARQILNALGSAGDGYFTAHLHALIGDWRSAIPLLADLPDCTAFYNIVDPAFASARRDPEFLAALKRIRLPCPLEVPLR